MRISSNSDYLNAMAGIEKAAAELARWQARVASGRRVNSPADDPAAAARSVEEHAEIGNLEQYARTTELAATRLSAVDSVLSDIVARLTAARASATAALGTGATQASREAVARELEGIADALLSDIRCNVRGTYVFSGSTALTGPYERLADGSVSGYLGDGNGMSVDIDRTRSVVVSFDATDITQGGDPGDVFTVLSQLAAAVRAGDQAGMTTGIEGLKRAFDRAVAFQTAVGTDLASLSDQGLRLSALRQAAVARVSKDEDVNLAEAISRMARADTAYQAALSAIGTRSRLTLLDYLR